MGCRNKVTIDPSKSKTVRLTRASVMMSLNDFLRIERITEREVANI